MVNMTHQTQPWLSLVFLVTVAVCSGRYFVHGEPQVPCYFIFGDSLVDAGNNNNLDSSAKANFLPYGIDFPGGPTGRFCNGRTTADIFSELLGFDDFIPSFLQANGSQILKGVNYASGASGIRAETGKAQGDTIELGRQLQNHQVTVSRIVELLGGDNVSATDHLNKCLYSFVIGNNDYINNYFASEQYNTSTEYTAEQYTEALIEEYSQHIRNLYSFGARKMSVAGVGPIGCSPGVTANVDTKGKPCIDEMNAAAMLFNTKLNSLIDTFNKELVGAKILYMNTFGSLPESNASPGSEINLKACCKVNEHGLCIPAEPACDDRNVYMFFDSFHPTEIANQMSAKVSFQSLQSIL